MSLIFKKMHLAGSCTGAFNLCQNRIVSCITHYESLSIFSHHAVEVGAGKLMQSVAGIALPSFVCSVQVYLHKYMYERGIHSIWFPMCLNG